MTNKNRTPKSRKQAQRKPIVRETRQAPLPHREANSGASSPANIKLIQITDPHLVPSGETLYGVDPEARLRACIADINANHRDAAMCLITGDLVHKGNAEAYGLLRAILDDLSVPYRLLLGNHDSRTVFRRCFPEADLDSGGFVQSVVEMDKVRLILLDTLEPGTHAGGYCPERQAWLAARLGESEKPALLFMHHPPCDIGMPSLDTISLMQREAFWRVVSVHPGRIHHIFFGHIHRPVMGSYRGVPFSAIRSTVHQCWLDFAAKDQPLGSHEPAGYGIILTDGAQTILHLHDYLDASERFKFEPRPGRVVERRARSGQAAA